MSEQLVRTVLEHWRRGDFRAPVALFADDISFSGTQPEGQVEARGHAAIAGFMRQFFAEWRLYRVEIDELEDLGGGRWLGTGVQRGEARSSGLDLTAPAFLGVRVREGRIVQLDLCTERQVALDRLDP